MADVATELLRELLDFALARATSVATSDFRDALSLATALRGGAPTADLQAKLQALIADFQANAASEQPTMQAVAVDVAAANAAVAQMSATVAMAPFTQAAASQAASELAAYAAALDDAILVIAGRLAARFADASLQPAVLAILAPWTNALAKAGAGVGGDFDAFVQQLTGVAGASGLLATALQLDRNKREVTFPVATGGARSPVPGFDAFAIDGVSITAFLDYGAAPALGVRVRASLSTGLRADGLVEQLVPASASLATSASISMQLDTAHGLALGDGLSPQLMLPGSFSFPGLSLRDMALAVPVPPPDSWALELTATIAGSLGGVIKMMVEGVGVRIGILASPAPGVLPITLALRPPDAASLSVDAGVVRGGGYLYHKGGEYGGALALTLGPIAITAIGFIGTTPFSLVLVIGVEFTPAIELSFGFTLNGVGGLLALERRVSSDELRKGIMSGTADLILFPKDPIGSAPTILAKLHDIFPYQAGGFVVGPILELGWGSQAKMVVAKLGIAISLPDPKLILIGALRVAVPSTELPPELAIVNLNAELFGEITTEHFLLVVGLSDSKVGNITISGDVGLLIAWGSSPEIAITAGGFHPHYTAPPELSGLRRIAIDMSPAIAVTLHAEGYVAITSNTVQFGAEVRLIADIGVARGEAWIGLDALFRWAPHLFFEVDIRAGIAISAFGESFLSVELSGHLEGMTPWKLQGNATVDVWYLPTIHFDVGPFQWGSASEAPLPAVSPMQLVFDALLADTAWSPRLPDGSDMLVRLADGGTTALLVHPLGNVEVQQIRVPLETPIDHMGRNPVTAHRVNIADPTVGANPAAAVSEVMSKFAPADFMNLTDDERLSRPGFEDRPAGARLAATAGPTAGPGVDTPYEWNTIFPKEQNLPSRRYSQRFKGVESAVLRAGPVARASRAGGQAYVGPYAVPPAPIQLTSPTLVEIRQSDDLSTVAAASGRMSTAVAAVLLGELRDSVGAESFELVAIGVA